MFTFRVQLFNNNNRVIETREEKAPSITQAIRQAMRNTPQGRNAIRASAYFIGEQIMVDIERTETIELSIRGINVASE